MSPSRIVALVAGLVLLALAAWALAAGRVLITWGRFAERPTFFYWVVVAALVLLGATNLWWGVASGPGRRGG